MSLRRILFVLVALIVSGVTIIAGRAWLQAEHPVQVEAKPQAPAKPTPMVLVAKGNLPAGQFVRPENVRWMPWPEDGVGANYIVEGKHRVEDFVGAVVRSGMADGEPITETRVVRPGDRGFMAAVLTPGLRAITVPVTVSSGNAGFVFPGDRVDLILTFSVKPTTVAAAGGGGGPQDEHRASETLLTDIRVLAVDQRADDQAKDVIVAKTATLEVTPKQAEIIAVATSFGQLSFSLRSLASGEPVDNAKPYTHTWDNEAARLLPPPITATSTIKVSVVRAGEVKEVEFPRSIR